MPLHTTTPGRPIRAGSTFETLNAARELWQQAQSFYRAHLTYTVAVTETDRMYGDVHQWLLEVMPDRKHRALVAESGPKDDYADISPADDTRRGPSKLRLSYSDRHPQTVLIDGHRVTVTVDQHDDAATTTGRGVRFTPARIEFRCRTQEAQRAVLTHLQRIHDERTKTRPILRLVNQWGSWARRADLPLRDLDSVILPNGQLDRIVDDLAAFLAAEQRYTHLALPWHRGYLFHGPPGTGKTSLVKALANHFGLDLWYVSLSDLKEEAGLMGLLSEVTPRSMLLLEDIDTVQISHDRHTQQGQISLSSLLNALDGVATPHGLVTVMTTNHYDRLDPALTRPGRIDRIEELTYPGPHEYARLYRHFYGQNLTVPIGPALISQAEASEIFKRHLDDPSAAAAALQTRTHSPQEATR